MDITMIGGAWQYHENSTVSSVSRIILRKLTENHFAHRLVIALIVSSTGCERHIARNRPHALSLFVSCDFSGAALAWSLAGQDTILEINCFANCFVSYNAGRMWVRSHCALHSNTQYSSIDLSLVLESSMTANDQHASREHNIFY